MRKWLIFFLFPASLLLAQGEKAFDVKVPKGFANSYDVMNLSDDFATDAQNILFDSDLGAIKRSGYARDNGVSFGSQPVNGLYQFVNPQGNEYLMAISSNQLLYSIGGGTYTTVFSTINPNFDTNCVSALQRFTCVNSSQAFFFTGEPV